MSSKMAWIFAAIFGVFLVIVIAKVTMFPSASDPTGATAGPGKLLLQKPTGAVTLVLPSQPSGAGDAGDDYRQAIMLYKSKQDAIETVCAKQREVVGGRAKLTASEVGLLRSVQDLIAAGAAKAKMTYTFRHTPTKIEPPYEATEAGDFQIIANVPIMLAYHYVAGGESSYPDAEGCLFDLFTMGWHMVNERARLDAVLAGVGLQHNACDLLRQLYGAKWRRQDRFKQVKAYMDGLYMITSIYADHQRDVIWHLPPHPGDMFNLASNHGDRAVRTEAIIGLGVVKLTCTGRGDRKYVHKLIAAKLASHDPIERAAAEAAKALDQDGLRRLLNPQSE